MSPAPSAAAVVFVTDAQRMSAFYRELASMRVLVEDHVHCVLEIDGFQLTVHAFQGGPPAAPTAHGVRAFAQAPE